MLTKEENDLLTRTDPGTSCGELMRRYWQPAALSEELPTAGAPIPVRLLGEDLVLFRDEEGRPALLGVHCSHRGADLSYGRLEDGGLRCIYHGWLYDIHGRCLEMPGEPAGSTFHERIHHTAYPCHERAGVIFAYLGPGDPPPAPSYGFLRVPDEHVFAIKLLSECNWLQGNEGNIDLIHSSFLHYTRHQLAEPGGELNSRGAAPHQECVEADTADFGLRVCRIRELGDTRRLSLGGYLFPCAFAFGGRPDAHSVNWHVPLDDSHHWKYTFIFDAQQPLDKEETRGRRAPMTPDYRPLRHRGNRYLQDRASMKTESYSGIGFINQPQDLCVTEGAGPIQDFSQQHLGAIDLPLVIGRHLLEQAIEDVRHGRPAPFLPQGSGSQILADYTRVIPRATDWRSYFQELDAAQGTRAGEKTGAPSP